MQDRVWRWIAFLAGVGATVTYRIVVSNPGSSVASGVVVTDEAPAGLTYLNSNPAATSNTHAKATSVTTSVPRIQACLLPSLEPRALSFKALCTAMEGTCIAGTNPNSRPVATAIRIVKPRETASTRTL